MAFARLFAVTQNMSKWGGSAAPLAHILVLFLPSLWKAG
jgi:hypothetical protein